MECTLCGSTNDFVVLPSRQKFYYDADKDVIGESEEYKFPFVIIKCSNCWEDVVGDDYTMIEKAYDRMIAELEVVE